MLEDLSKAELLKFALTHIWSPSSPRRVRVRVRARVRIRSGVRTRVGGEIAFG